MRELIFNDVYSMSKILKKIDIKLEANEKQIIDGKTVVTQKTQGQVGMELILTIGENLHLAQNEVNNFLGSMVNLTGEEFSQLPIIESLKYIEEFKKLPGIKDFFKSATRLMK